MTIVSPSLRSLIVLWIVIRLKLELIALRRCFHPHCDNSPLRKWTTIILFATWAALTIGVAYGVAIETWVYWPITVIVIYILGRQHEAEFHRLIRPK